MGVQSFQFPVDFLNNLEKPIIFIANKHKEILDSVSVYDNLSLTCNLNAFQTASFKIYRDVDGKKQDYFKLFEEEMLIMIPGISWYEIHVETNIEPTGITKSITATSLECTLCNKRLVDFQVNSDDFEDDDYVITKFYNPTDPKKSLLNRVLNVSPVWTVGHVDQSLWNIQRTFDESDVDVYSFLTGTVSEAFNCLFTFDTFNCTVNAYDLDNYGSNTNIFVSMDNLAQNMTETIDENSIFTCYRITGGDDIQIAEVNPNGTNKIYNFEYYLPMMPVELQSKVKQYDVKYQELKPKYEDIVKRLGDQIYVIQELNTKYPDSLASKDWTLYGLSGLETYKKSFETQNELFCAQGMNKPASLNYNLYTQNLENLNAVTAEYNKRLSEINEATNVYQSIVSEMKSLQSELDMNVWFTEDEWKILDSYVIEQTYSNDNFGAVDNTTESELFSMEKELYDKAWEDLSKKCRPQYQYSSTLSNILTIPEFKEFVPYFELGNFIQMETDYDTIVRLRIISFTVDYSNTQTIAVTFSDAIRVKEMYDDISSIQAQATSSAMSFQFNKDQYDKTVKQGNFVAEMRKYGLDVATVAIHNASNQNQTWDDTGFTFRKWNDESQRYDPEQIKIINNQIVFSDDGFDTVRMALGKIALPNGEYGYGINTEVLMGIAIFGEKLKMQNSAGTFGIDDNGFNATNGTNTIKIQPNNSGELFSIYKGSNKQFYINSDGDVEFAGTLRGATGIFSGLISGGSININNVFQVDKNGNMTATSCNISGNISSSNITSSSATFGNVTLNSNGITSPYFTIGSSGASFSGTITANNGKVGDFTISDGELSYGNFGVYGSSNQFTNISPNGKYGTLFLSNTGKDYMYSKWTFASTAFGVNTLGEVFAREYNALNENGGTSIKGDSITVNGAWNVLKKKTVITGESITVDGKKVSLEGHPHNITDLDYTTTPYGNIYFGNYNLATTDWCNSTFSKSGHSHSEYSRTGHSHNLTDLSYSTTGYGNIYFGSYNLATTSWVSNNFEKKGSDIRLKTEISDLQDISSFYMQLIPKKYKFKNGLRGYDDRLHYGFIAQEIESIITEKSSLVYKNLCDRDLSNENEIIGDDYFYCVDKDELHAMHVQMIQKHQREIEHLQRQIKELERKIS